MVIFIRFKKFFHKKIILAVSLEKLRFEITILIITTILEHFAEDAFGRDGHGHASKS
jgi:hypothetical protein